MTHDTDRPHVAQWSEDQGIHVVTYHLPTEQGCRPVVLQFRDDDMIPAFEVARAAVNAALVDQLTVFIGDLNESIVAVPLSPRDAHPTTKPLWQCRICDVTADPHTPGWFEHATGSLHRCPKHEPDRHTRNVWERS
jgi:hypothetical protein